LFCTAAVIFGGYPIGHGHGNQTVTGWHFRTGPVRQITLQSPALEQGQFPFLSRNGSPQSRFPAPFSKMGRGVQRFERSKKNNQPKGLVGFKRTGFVMFN